MATCNCMGPQNGQPLCPCQMRAAQGWENAALIGSSKLVGEFEPTWQPIDTAPQEDGSWILGCVAGTKLPVPCCYDPDWGWFPLNMVFKNWKPTHWKPLPKLPEA